MVEPSSLTIRPILTPSTDAPNSLGESTTLEYKGLLDSFLNTEAMPTREEVVIKEEAPLAHTQFSSSDVANITVLEQQVNDQLRAIEQRLISIQNSASRASTNTTRLEKDLKHSLPLNEGVKAKFFQSLKAARRMSGGNLDLITSYKASLKGINSYINLMTKLNRQLDESIKLLLKIESSTDIVFAEIDSESSAFRKSLETTAYVNNYTNSINSINDLMQAIEESSVRLSEFTVEMKTVSSQLESRSKEIKKYLKGPNNPNLYLKDRKEFSEELELLSNNLEVLSLNMLIVPTFEKTKVAIGNQLGSLKAFIDQLKEANHVYVKNQLGQKSEKELMQISYNGKSATVLVGTMLKV